MQASNDKSTYWEKSVNLRWYIWEFCCNNKQFIINTKKNDKLFLKYSF